MNNYVAHVQIILCQNMADDLVLLGLLNPTSLCSALCNIYLIYEAIFVNYCGLIGSIFSYGLASFNVFCMIMVLSMETKHTSLKAQLFYSILYSHTAVVKATRQAQTIPYFQFISVWPQTRVQARNYQPIDNFSISSNLLSNIGISVMLHYVCQSELIYLFVLGCVLNLYRIVERCFISMLLLSLFATFRSYQYCIFYNQCWIQIYNKMSVPPSMNPNGMFKSSDLLISRQRKLSSQSGSQVKNQMIEMQKINSNQDNQFYLQKKMSQSSICDMHKNPSDPVKSPVVNFATGSDSPIRSLTSPQMAQVRGHPNSQGHPQKPFGTLKQQQSIRFRNNVQFPSQSQTQSIKEQVRNIEPLNFRSFWLFLKLILLSYEFNVLEYLHEIDATITDEAIELLKIAPGYKPIQYIYTFYMLKYGIVTGTMAALIYPLPYSILFLMITVDLEVPLVAIFMLAGMRSGAIALLLKYCFHFPKHAFHWIVFVFTILIGIFLCNNYIYLLLFAISIFLSLYIRKSDSRTSMAADSDSQRWSSPDDMPLNLQVSTFGLNFNSEQIYKGYQVNDKLPQTYGGASLAIIGGSILILWVMQRYIENRDLSIFGQVVPVSLLMSSREMLAFFPYIYKQWIGQSTLSSNTLISLSFLFPGPHSKAFMFFIVHTQILNVVIAYACLYLPPILLVNIYIAYRRHFFSPTYYNIRQSIQAVGNGIVFCLVFEMLSHQPCFFNSICYSAVVIMVVAKLYRLRELFAITLGIFLISTRTIILNVNKQIPFQVQACIPIIGAS